LAFRPANTFTETQLQNAGIPDVNSDGFYEFGGVGGSTSGFDIDSVLTGYNAGQLSFNAIEITDVIDLSCPANTPGADIDAVCALSFEQLSVNEIYESALSIYPNPTRGNFTVDLGKEFTNVNVQITDILGKIVSSTTHVSAKTIEQKINGPVGMYFVQVKTSNSSIIKQIVKQ